MSLTTITDWLTFVPASRVDKVGTHVDIPVFNYPDQKEQISLIITQFNYTASSNFVLLSRPTKPNNVNYVPCVRFRVGSTIYRYKLWEDIDANIEAPLYTNQLILKNFVVEIWSISTKSVVSNSSVLRLITSVKNTSTNLYVRTSTALATGVEYIPVQASSELALPGSLILDYNPNINVVESSFIISDFASSANTYPLTRTGADDSSLLTPPSTSINGNKYVQNAAGNTILSGATPLYSDAIFVFYYTAASPVSAQDIASGDFGILRQSASNPRLSWYVGTGTYESTDLVSGWYIVSMRQNLTTHSNRFRIFSLYDNAVVYDSGDAFLVTISAVGATAIGSSATPLVSFARMLLLSASTNAQIQEAEKYLTNFFTTSIELTDIDFGSGNAWLDNP